MKGTYGGKAATFRFIGDSRMVWYNLDKDPGSGSMHGTTSVTANVEITEATAVEFGRLVEAWRASLRHLTPTTDGGAFHKQQIARYLGRAAEAHRAEHGYAPSTDTLVLPALDAAVRRGTNEIAEEGVTRCSCGCKYWENDRCVDCGTRVDVCYSHERANCPQCNAPDA